MASTFVQCIAEPEDVSGEEDPLVARRKNKDESTKPEITFMSSANEVIRGGPISILLIFVPCALVSNAINMPEGLTFTLSLLGLAPMAERLGFVTEQLALHTNESVGGLLNATFGNATELIVAATALFKGLYRLVQLSMLGSILSNMLLVLGSAFFLGGNRHKAQTFSKISSQMNATLLILSCLAILGPTILTMSGEESRLGELGFSRITSIMLIIMYFAFLYFQVSGDCESYVHLTNFNFILYFCLLSCFLTRSCTSLAHKVCTAPQSQRYPKPAHRRDYILTHHQSMSTCQLQGWISILGLDLGSRRLRWRSRWMWR